MKRSLGLASVILLLLIGTVAQAESQVERQACENDAFRVCSAAIPNRHNVFLCLMTKRRQLSPPCQAVMAQYSRPNYRHEQAARRPTTTGFGGYSH